MRIILLLSFFLIGYEVMAYSERPYFDYYSSDPIGRSFLTYRPELRDIESSPRYLDCVLRMKGKSLHRSPPRGTERSYLESCVKVEEARDDALYMPGIMY